MNATDPDSSTNIVQQVGRPRLFSLGLGGVLIAAGIYLAGVAFLESRALLHGPQPLAKWIALRAVIHTKLPTSEAKETRFFKIEGRVSMIGPDEVYALGGYICVFLGILVLFVLARIGLSFISTGAMLVVGARKGARGL